MDWAKSGDNVRGTWNNFTDAFNPNELNDTFTYSEFSGNDDDLRANPFNPTLQQGTISSVEAVYMIYVDTAGGQLSGDEVESNIHTNLVGNAAPALQNLFDNTQLNAASTPTLFAFDVTGLESADGWQWSDFSKYFISINASKVANADGAELYLDSMGWRVTFEDSCGGAEDTVVTVPLTDEFDPSVFELVSAIPSPDSVTTDINGSTYTPAGLINWNNLGPLYAGQTKTVTVTLKALEPSTNPENTTNYARVRNALFANGSLVNDGDAQDDVNITPSSTIGDTVWNDNGAGSGTAGDGVQDTGEIGLPGVSISLLSQC